MNVRASHGAVDLMEEAVHLLRGAPGELHVLWALGVLPYCLGLLWFAAEMSWSSFASEHIVETSFALALLFCWKQVFEAVYSARVHELVTGAVEPWSRVRLFRLIAVQCAVQPLSLLALPLSLVLTLPFATTVAFFRSLSVYAGTGSVHAMRLARLQCVVETRQNWLLQSLLGILGLLLLLNYAAALVMIPQLGRSIFGIETTASRFPMWLITSTGILSVGLLVYATLEPLVTTIYVLRCFYGQSIQSGADIRASLRRITEKTALASIALALFLLSAAPSPAQTAPAPQRNTQQAVNSDRLQRSISTVVRRSEFAWRMPRPADDPNKQRPKWASWLEGVFNRLGEFWDWLVEGIRRIFQNGSKDVPGKDGEDAWAQTLTYSLWALGAVFAVAAALLLYRQRSASRKVAESATALSGSGAAVDLHDESITADKLPENSWLELAQEWITKGDLRLALRAMHLAALSHLNGRGLLTVQRWKTGLEYCVEVERRSRALPELAPVFARNVKIFEAGWYGRHPVSADAIAEFQRGLQKLRSHENSF